MGKIWIILLVTVYVIFSLLFITDQIRKDHFITLIIVWLVMFLILYIGPETITEITAWKLSIKRDVKAAKEIRNEVEKIMDKLRDVTKISVENAYILASSSFLAMGGDGEARKKIEENLIKLSKFVEPNKKKEDSWWKKLTALFSHRKRK